MRNSRTSLSRRLWTCLPSNNVNYYRYSSILQTITTRSYGSKKGKQVVQGRDETTKFKQQKEQFKSTQEKVSVGSSEGVSKTFKNRGQGVPVEFTVRDLHKVLYTNNQVIFDNVSFSTPQGSKVGIVGANGAGKSSLLRILAGEDTDYQGDLTLPDPEKRKLGYLPQEPELDPTKTVMEIILESVSEQHEALERYIELKETDEDELDEDDTEELEDLQKKLEEWNLRGTSTSELTWRIDRAISALRCPEPSRLSSTLSGGEKRRVALCRALISHPDILLIDEPTNHLDSESVSWLEQFLDEFKGTVLAITHDRYFLENVADCIMEVDRGQIYTFHGNYSAWLKWKQGRLNLESKRDDHRRKQMETELEWINKSAKAGQKKSKNRIKRYEDLVKEQENKQRLPEPGRIVIPPGKRLGDVVIQVQNLSKQTTEGKRLFDRLNFKLEKGVMLGIIGPNGAGKTTLLRIISGEVPPDEGNVTIGTTVDMGYVAQIRNSLRDEKTVFEEISEGQEEIMSNTGPISMRLFVAAFNFQNEMQQRRVRVLSGGERNRVHLAKMLKRGPNVVLLDEPTNDLDVDVLRNLEEALVNFVGSAVIVTHDRWFLDRICTAILAFEEDGEVVYFDGNYSEYRQNKLKRKPEEGLLQKKFVKIK